MENKCLFCYGILEEKEIDFHAKCSKIFFGSPVAPKLNYTLGEMADLAKNVVESSVAVTGVQPKLSLGLVKSVLENGNLGRLTVVGALGGNFILKPANKNFPEMAENEHLTMKLAEILKIKTVKSSLIKLQSGELSYITKRIDRTEKGEKIHMIDMFQILDAFDKYRSSLEKVGKAIIEHSANTLLDVLNFFEVVIFSYITANSDMHLKNFSMILENGNWSFSPSYDLLNVNLHLPEDTEESALTLGGKKNKIVKKDFINLGLKLGLNEKQIENTFKKMIKNENKMIELIKNSFLSEVYQNQYVEILQKRLSIFE